MVSQTWATSATMVDKVFMFEQKQQTPKAKTKGLAVTNVIAPGRQTRIGLGI